MKLSTRVLAALLSASFFSACGGGSEGAVSSLCTRFDECNVLNGQSISECETAGNACVEANLPGAAADDWTRQIESCLETSTCQALITCYQAVPTC